MLKKAMFEIDGGAQYEGYTRNEQWNGWACPMFTKDVVEKMAIDKEKSDSMAFIYDAYRDRFLVLFYEDDAVDEPEIYESTTIIYNNEEIKVYAIGVFSWCWDEVEWN